MPETMTSKERLLTAILCGKPDRVPVSPDISSMVPCRLSGKPDWDIHYYKNPYPPSGYTNQALGRAYMAAAEYYGIDAWYMYGNLHLKTDSQVTQKIETIKMTGDRIVTRCTFYTPEGEMYEEDTFLPADSPTKTSKRIKNFKEDFPKLKYFYPNILGYDSTEADDIKNNLVGDKGIYCFICGVPGFQDWIFSFDGGVEAMTWAYYDYPDLVEELVYMQHRFVCRQVEMMLDARPDVLFVGASGALTLQSPEMFRKMGLPTLKKISRMSREAGIPTMMHTCGKSAKLVEMLAEETDINCINPLEAPPMGDVDLKELKQKYGKKLCLMGNLHTVEIMLNGTPEDVERAAKQAIDDAAEGGGYILSTGDQCGRNTPDENIFKLVEVAKTYGMY
jgi:uroporphyrinogen decarboxylase